jgi:copper chaperone
MADIHVYTAPGMTCAHCEQAVKRELAQVAGVESVTVDLSTKTVVVDGSGLSDDALRGAIQLAGYEAS